MHHKIGNNAKNLKESAINSKTARLVENRDASNTAAKIAALIDKESGNLT